jgi:hypothetical protein
MLEKVGEAVCVCVLCVCVYNTFSFYRLICINMSLKISLT